MDIEAEINELKSRVTALELDMKAKNTPAEPPPAQPVEVAPAPGPVAVPPATPTASTIDEATGEVKHT